MLELDRPIWNRC